MSLADCFSTFVFSLIVSNNWPSSISSTLLTKHEQAVEDYKKIGGENFKGIVRWLGHSESLSLAVFLFCDVRHFC